MTISAAHSGTTSLITETLLAAHGIGRLPVPLPGEGWAPADTTPAPREHGALPPPSDPETRALYRWVLGHHGAVGVWRLLGDTLSGLVRDPAASHLHDTAAGWFDCYSALLLYAGSCTPQRYETAIRRRMVAEHPAFSGIWARDYEWVAGLLARVHADQGSVLKEAVLRNRQVHMAIGKRLVPGGTSLLKKAGRRASQGATDGERDLFDRFFALERASVSRARFRAHVVMRVAAVEEDLARHPLDEDDPLHRLLPASVSTLVRVMAAEPPRGGSDG
ncbi:L-tyrosine 3-hydroxylase [Lentzea sp. NPDC059081]|uniref:L-tyrosine 3-hydroxylase n=1 Tax=Lentzea sp. NPDC059081 TaxID=3346719 RepID=UPI003686FA1E